MKTRFGNKLTVTIMFFILLLATYYRIAGQTTMGILPVNVSAASSYVLTSRQCQMISLQLHDQFVTQLSCLGNVEKLSREHILLLLKEIPDPDPECLDAEDYKLISKKEDLNYLLKCSVESIRVVNKTVLAISQIVIVDCNNGKIFWENKTKINKAVSNPDNTEQILIDEVFKPYIQEISEEIKSLKY